MARQPCMGLCLGLGLGLGLGLLFPRLRALHICGSSETSRLAALFNSILM
jgi:hypothetical protein